MPDGTTPAAMTSVQFAGAASVGPSARGCGAPAVWARAKSSYLRSPVGGVPTATAMERTVVKTTTVATIEVLRMVVPPERNAVLWGRADGRGRNRLPQVRLPCRGLPTSPPLFD